MPRSGEKNTAFGVYKNACCGLEIVISIGSKFPICSNHPKLITEWKQIDPDRADAIVINKKSKTEPAA